MTNSLDYEKEIDEIRAKLYEEYLSMGHDAWHQKISDNAHELAKQYGFKIIPSVSADRRSAA